MKISRFLICVWMMTLACLIYVWQQVKLVELNYGLLKREKQFVKLVDKNRIMKYNVSQLKSPETVEKKLLASHIKMKYTTPLMITHLDKDTNGVSTADQDKNLGFAGKTKKTLSEIFTLRSQVEAMP